ncbi:hypothetical protein ACX80W_12945 [Arthrobacter sp. TMN-37]
MVGILSRPKAARLNRRALDATAAGDWDAAEDVALRALTLLPDISQGLPEATARADPLLTLAAISAEARDHAKAQEWLTEAAALLNQVGVSPTRDVRLAEVLTRLGDTLRLSRKHHRAAEALAAVRGN